MSDVLRSLKISISGSTFNSIRKHIALNGISIEHLGVCGPKTFIPLKDEEVFVRNPPVSNKVIRRRLLKTSEYRCLKCSNPGLHEGENLTLQMDHIDGDRSNNLRENLRWLCPNCHSQTSTFSRIKDSTRVRLSLSRKEKKPREMIEIKCGGCGIDFMRRAHIVRNSLNETNFCSSKCNHSYNSSLRKVDPSKAIERFKETGSKNAVAKEFGVSFQAIAKIIRKYGLKRMLHDEETVSSPLCDRGSRGFESRRADQSVM